jgi:hypothetical protein
MMVRFARKGQKQFNVQLIATLAVSDFCYALKTMIASFNIVAISTSGSTACFIWAWVDPITVTRLELCSRAEPCFDGQVALQVHEMVSG